MQSVSDTIDGLIDFYRACALPFYFHPLIFWYLAQHVFPDIRKSQKTIMDLFEFICRSLAFILDISLYNWSVKCKFGIRYIFLKKICVYWFKFILLVYSLTQESGISCFFCYIIFTNIRVGSIYNWIFTNVKVRSITNIPSIA